MSKKDSSAKTEEASKAKAGHEAYFGPSGQPMDFGLTDEQILIVGKIALNWGRAEFFTGAALITALGSAPEEYQATLQSLDMSKKVSMLNDLLKKGRIPDSCEGHLSALSFATNNFRSGRNIFAHGAAVITPAGQVIMTGKGQALHTDDLPLALVQSQYALAAAMWLPSAVQSVQKPWPLPRKPNRLPARSGLGSLLEDGQPS